MTLPSLLAERTVLHRDGPHVVCIGGGHGLAQVLQAVVGYAGTVTAIVTVSDDGGSSGRLAPALDVPPPGDIRRCLLALTPPGSPWRRIFDYRFAGSDVAGHSLGNLILAALADLDGDFPAAVQSAENLLGTRGSVVPAAPTRLQLHAEIDGSAVSGQVAISRSRGRVDKLWVTPDHVTATPRAVAAILAADQVILGPGSLYTSVLATLAVPGIVDAIRRSPARLVYVANLITQDGETLGMDAADHVEAMLSLVGIRAPGAIVAEAGPVVASPPLEPVRVEPEVLATYGADVVFADLVDPGWPWPQHDPERLRKTLGGLASP